MTGGARRGAFWRGLGRGGAGRLDGRWRWCDGVEGRGWRVIGGAVVGRGCREGAGAQRERGQAWHEWGQGQGQGERGERVAAIGGGRSRAGSRRQRRTGSRRRRRASSGSRSEAVGIWRSGCEAYSASVHYLRTDGKSGSVGAARCRTPASLGGQTGQGRRTGRRMPGGLGVGPVLEGGSWW